MKKTIENGVTNLHFYGVQDLVEYIKYTPETNTSVAYWDNEWCGGTFKHALELAKYGDKTNAQNIYEGLVKLRDADKYAEASRYVKDVAGEYYDVGEYLAGEPECFFAERGEPARPVVEVVASVSMSSRISAESIRNRGAAIVALCDALDEDGYSVDLQIVFGAFGLPLEYGIRMYCYLHLATDPIDLDAVGFVLANASFQRRLMFAVMEKATGKRSLDRWQYGTPCDIQPKAGQVYFCSSRHGEFNSHNYATPKSAAEHIRTALTDFDGTAAVTL